jgi:flagellin
MANIGATTAFYKVETSLTRANNEVSKSMERLATGKQNANAGDRSSYVAMADTFRLDYVGTKAGIKGASVVMGYLETGMRVIDSASALVARIQELAVLGANATNTVADHEAINLEAEALGNELYRLLSTAKYKGKDLFVTSANSEYVSLGGRDAEMRFGIKSVHGSDEFKAIHAAGRGSTYGHAQITGNSNAPHASDSTLAAADGFNMKILPSEAVISMTSTTAPTSNTNVLTDKLEDLQKVLNTARVQAGSQYAALESAVSYTTDLTAQYELGFNTVNDVNFSMETAHLAKNQILQQAATAMLAQANSGQQGLLQLIQG